MQSGKKNNNNHGNRGRNGGGGSNSGGGGGNSGSNKDQGANAPWPAFFNPWTGSLDVAGSQGSRIGLAILSTGANIRRVSDPMGVGAGTKFCPRVRPAPAP
jgi:hypothetical protein